MRHSHAPHHRLVRLLAALQHVDDGFAALAQTDALKHSRRLTLFLGLFFGRLLLGFLRCDGRLQGGDGRRHVARLDDAFGIDLFAYELQKLFALGFKQYQVTSGFGFEFVKHARIVRLLGCQGLSILLAS